MMNKIKVFLAEDHPLVRKGIRSILDQEFNVEVIGEAENGREALTKIEQLLPDMVILDISMPILNGLEVTRQIKKRQPKIKIIILTMHTSEEYVFEIMQAGASGYVLKQSAPKELVIAIYEVNMGRLYFSTEISKNVIDRLDEKKLIFSDKDMKPDLTEREREIIQLVAEGNTTRKIADILFISPKTVESHRTNLMNKLDIHSVADLTRYAIENRII